MARRPLPQDPWPGILEAIIRDVTGIYAATEERLIQSVALELRARDITEQAPRLAAIQRLRAAGEAAAAEVQEQTGPLADDVIMRALATGESFAEAWTRAVLGELPGPRLAHGTIATSLLAQDLHNRFDDVTRRILRWPDDTYREVIARTVPGILIGGDTGRQAQTRAWRELRRAGVTGFIDSADRRWNLATYVEMATRTATRRAFTDSNLATLSSYGIDLVTPIGGGGMCDVCGRWVGKVLSQGGTGARTVEVPHSTRDTTVTVRVAGSVDDAIADGWGHPNDRCTLVGYFPGMAQDPGPAWDRESEDAQARLRSLEVEVRKSKRDAIGALDEDEAKAARRKTRDLQAKIRDHIDETGEPRRREREQLNYGHHPGPR